MTAKTLRRRQRHQPLRLMLAALLSLSLALLSACGTDGGGDRSKTIRVAYQLFGGSTTIRDYFTSVKAQFEAKNPGVHVELVPVVAGGNDYFTKLNLMRGSDSTAPDVVYQDTFQINSDVEAGFLRPLDDRLAAWPEWKQFAGSEDAVRGRDGKIYGVPAGTDTRALWYDKQLLREAGVDLPWRPKNWQDLLETARAIKREHPDVMPLNLYAGSAVGEVTSMQGLEMLLYGTKDTLYDPRSKTWTGRSEGMRHSLEFVRKLYSEGLGPPPNVALDPNVNTRMSGTFQPERKVAISIDGSWLPSDWGEGGSRPWPEWPKKLGVAAMPTQHGQEPKKTSMSGGWALGVSSTAPDPDLAFDFVTLAMNKKNALEFAIQENQIAVRKDVAREPRYLRMNPTVEFFSDLVRYTNFRPAFPEYPRISNSIQIEMEAVMMGERTPAEAEQKYADSVRDIVGTENMKGTASARSTDGDRR